MWRAIAQIIANFSAPVSKLWSNKIDNDNTPEAIAKRKREAIARNIIKGDSLAESVRLNDSLRALRNRTERQGGNHSEVGSKDNRAP